MVAYAQPSSGPVVVRAATVALVAASVTEAAATFGLSALKADSMILAGVATPGGTQIASQYELFPTGTGNTQLRVQGRSAAAVAGEDDTSVLTVFIIDPAGWRETPEGYGDALEARQVQLAGAPLDSVYASGAQRNNAFVVAPNPGVAVADTTVGVQYRGELLGLSQTEFRVTAIDGAGATQPGDDSLVNVLILNSDFNPGHRLAPSGNKMARVAAATFVAGVATIPAASFGLAGIKTGAMAFTQLVTHGGTQAGAVYEAVVSSTNVVVTSRTAAGATTGETSAIQVMLVLPPNA